MVDEDKSDDTYYNCCNEPAVQFHLKEISTPAVYSSENNKYRGGTIGYVSGDLIYGFGHKTIDENHHDIFYWELDMKSLILKLKDVKKPSKSMNITDPTSIIFIDDDKFLVTAESDEKWVGKSGDEIIYKTRIYKIFI